jgi:hypothetical protein
VDLEALSQAIGEAPTDAVFGSAEAGPGSPARAATPTAAVTHRTPLADPSVPSYVTVLGPRRRWRLSAEARARACVCRTRHASPSAAFRTGRPSPRARRSPRRRARCSRVAVAGNGAGPGRPTGVALVASSQARREAFPIGASACSGAQLRESGPGPSWWPGAGRGHELDVAGDDRCDDERAAAPRRPRLLERRMPRRGERCQRLPVLAARLVQRAAAHVPNRRSPKSPRPGTM